LNQPIDRGKVLKASLFAIIAAVVVNLITRAILGLFYPIDPAFPPLSYGAIAIFTAFYCLIGSLVFYLVVRFTKNPARNFIILSVVGLLVSLIQNFMAMANPAAMPMGGTSSDYAVLIIFHVTAFIAYLYTLLRFSRV
jgi:H+/Cl- antiporter ClcA